MEIFDEPFRIAKYQALENQSYLNRQRSEAQAMGMGMNFQPQTSGTSNTGYRVGMGKQSPMKQGGTYQQRRDIGEESLGASHLEETLNNRDV